jgi:hypothetical protein
MSLLLQIRCPVKICNHYRVTYRFTAIAMPKKRKTANMHAGKAGTKIKARTEFLEGRMYLILYPIFKDQSVVAVCAKHIF